MTATGFPMQALAIPRWLLRSRWFAAAGVVLAVGCAALPGSRQPPLQPSRVLTVMTYNIQYGGGGTRLEEVAEAIRATGAEVVALQEVDVHWSDRSGFRDQAAELAAALAMEIRFAPIYSYRDGEGARPAREFGVALLSRHPVTSFTNHPLTRLSTQDRDAVPRPHPGLLEATVSVEGMRLRVFNTHLDYRADPSVRRAQVAEMLTLIGEAPSRTILLGDLNAEPDAAELAPLLTVLRDGWAEAGDGGAGYTYPSPGPVKRIDYVLLSPDLEARRASVPTSTASDHRPVVLEIVLPRR